MHVQLQLAACTDSNLFQLVAGDSAPLAFDVEQQQSRARGFQAQLQLQVSVTVTFVALIIVTKSKTVRFRIRLSLLRCRSRGSRGQRGAEPVFVHSELQLREHHVGLQRLQIRIKLSIRHRLGLGCVVVVQIEQRERLVDHGLVGCRGQVKKIWTVFAFAFVSCANPLRPSTAVAALSLCQTQIEGGDGARRSQYFVFVF